VALNQFKAQGGREVLVNMGSMLGIVGEPFVSAYVATKFAIRGLSACLRQECLDTPGIRVCTVSRLHGIAGGARHADLSRRRQLFRPDPTRNFPGLFARDCARIVVRLAERPRPEAPVGIFAYALMLAARLAPRVLERMVGRFAAGLQFEKGDAPPVRGNYSRASIPARSAAAGKNTGSASYA
jgi:short-subunit dehydrogenase